MEKNLDLFSIGEIGVVKRVVADGFSCNIRIFPKK